MYCNAEASHGTAARRSRKDLPHLPLSMMAVGDAWAGKLLAPHKIRRYVGETRPASGLLLAETSQLGPVKLRAPCATSHPLVRHMRASSDSRSPAQALEHAAAECAVARHVPKSTPTPLLHELNAQQTAAQHV